MLQVQQKKDTQKFASERRKNVEKIALIYFLLFIQQQHF